MAKNISKIVILFILICGGFELLQLSFVSNAEEINDEQKLDDFQDKYYKDFYDCVDFDEMSEDLNRINRKYGYSDNVSLEELYQCLISGDIDSAICKSFEFLYVDVAEEILENRDLIIRLILLSIIAAIFSNYSSVFRFSFIGEQGFYVTYLMIVLLLMQSFRFIFTDAENTILYIKDIMFCMLPALFTSLMFCGGFTTAYMTNSFFLTMLSYIEKLLFDIVLPAIRIYFLIVVLNQINPKDQFSKLALLIKQGIEFLLKMIVTGIIGLNVTKSILIPVYDNAQYSAVQKGLSILPGGASFSGLSTILLGASVLIKNCVGIVIVFVLLICVSVPLLKILCFCVMYKIILVFIQPISETRILKGIQGAADSAGLLLRATSTSLVLSILSIAIILITTNVRLYVS